MLILSRRIDESLTIDDNVTTTVLEVGGQPDAGWRRCAEAACSSPPGGLRANLPSFGRINPGQASEAARFSRLGSPAPNRSVSPAPSEPIGSDGPSSPSVFAKRFARSSLFVFGR